MKEIRIATRPSKLAVKQAEIVADLLRKKYPEIKARIIKFATNADKNVNVPITELGGKGIFVKELEQALRKNEADIAIHSVKDMPSIMLEDFTMPAILTRANAEDVLISKNDIKLHNLPAGAIVGTSSLRRKLQLKKLRPDLNFKEIRGNIDTRINKVSQSYDAIILAYAGLERLNLTEKISEIFPLETLLPAAGQAALGIECLRSKSDIIKMIAALDDPKTAACVISERTLMSQLGGHCQAPIAAYAQLKSQKICLTSRVIDKYSGKVLEVSKYAEISKPKELGKLVAEELLSLGAQKIIVNALER